MTKGERIKEITSKLTPYQILMVMIGTPYGGPYGINKQSMELTDCQDMLCGDCLFYGFCCTPDYMTPERIQKWLNEEYEDDELAGIWQS